MRKAVILPWFLALALSQSSPTHTVQRGDTLYSIARRYGTTVETLMQLNRLEDATLSVGQVLLLPARALEHTVQRGETLYSIARRYGSSVEALQQENNLTSTVITPGQVLRIPQAALPPEPPPEPPADTDFNPQHPLIQVVLKYLGLPYVFGAQSNRAVDCSAFVQQVFAELGIRLPRTSREQWAALPTVQGALRQGDLVFFSFGGGAVDHVGIYLGRGVFAHASSHGSRVVIESLDSPFYKRVYRGAKRIEGP
ncbi:peptidoglycan endopeptidase [Meiothermus sp. QL-1]|uniref:C40 family peptidase n=1 Tax=Meiothermus sp. QL-1 TaxID=2058095 RepID=UPI000E0C1E98|nr:C40 family peptidase [Meiothermus sp. QL-1]RDI95259.1 peptidoglycan endopeptidase [Meiothermus sp. QL-1]